MTSEFCTFVDGHVHMHPGFDAGQALDSAAANLEVAAKRINHRGQSLGVLLLAEMHGYDWFGTTRASVVNGNAVINGWSIGLANEPETFIAHSDVGQRELLVIAGRQIVTAERIEVLALLTPEHFPDGLSIDETLAAAHSVGALVVLPWGVGKWFGGRGRLVRHALSRLFRVCLVLAGVFGGRPW